MITRDVGCATIIRNIGVFSDAEFDMIAAFLTSDAGRFMAEVDAIAL